MAATSRLVLVTMLTCATTTYAQKASPALPPGTTVTFTATVQGEHRYRTEIKTFFETVDARMTILESGVWQLRTSHPSCAVSKNDDVKHKRNEHRFSCGDVRVTLDQAGQRIIGGSMSVRLPQEIDVEGVCMYEDPRPGRRGVCLEPSYRRTLRPAWSQRREIEIDPQLD